MQTIFVNSNSVTAFRICLSRISTLVHLLSFVYDNIEVEMLFSNVKHFTSLTNPWRQDSKIFIIHLFNLCKHLNIIYKLL